jgi:hypothetical protein
VRDGKAISFQVTCEIARSFVRTVEDALPVNYAYRLDECYKRYACN